MRELRSGLPGRAKKAHRRGRRRRGLQGPKRRSRATRASRRSTLQEWSRSRGPSREAQEESLRWIWAKS
ncbi:unnamed protein product [Effrenium voratum]|nr:unnamed protein product [Effrenium voratum]